MARFLYLLFITQFIDFHQEGRMAEHFAVLNRLLKMQTWFCTALHENDQIYVRIFSNRLPESVANSNRSHRTEQRHVEQNDLSTEYCWP